MQLDEIRIRSKLGKKYAELPMFIYKITDSTNLRAKEYAKEGNRKLAVFIADEQSSGRGRLGRSFSSQSGAGLYLSILTEGGMPAECGIDITTYMAVIASEAISELTGIDVKIKWVNDLYAGGKKLSGILTEGQTDENGNLSYSVCGIGVNILKREFPEEIRDIATAVEDECGSPCDVNELAANIIKSFLDNIHLIGSKKIARKYKKRSFLMGKSIKVIKKSEEYPATVTDITDRCMLKLRLQDGSEEILSTGEVSVRETFS